MPSMWVPENGRGRQTRSWSGLYETYGTRFHHQSRSLSNMCEPMKDIDGMSVQIIWHLEP